MSWGGGQTGPETGVGGLNRGNLSRIEAGQEELIHEAEESRRDEPDEDDDKTIKEGYRNDLINKLTIIAILAFLIGLVLYLRIFVAH